VIVELGDHNVCEQSRTRLAPHDGHGGHFPSDHRVAASADHALFNVADDLHGRRNMLQNLSHPVGRLQERGASTRRATAWRLIDRVLSRQGVRQRLTFGPLLVFFALGQRGLLGKRIALRARGLDLLEHQLVLLDLAVDLLRRRAVLAVA